MSVPTPSPAPLLRDLIDIPEQVSAGDFVLRLLEGIDRRAQTVADYVVTPQLVGAFDSALGLIGSALGANTSKGSYLHGSFGSGKSHFMAVLDALVDGDPAALAIPELAPVIAKHTWLGTRKLMLVPTNLIGAESLESGILGGYAQHVAKYHPDKPVPALLRAGGMLLDLARIRDAMGSTAFAERLRPVAVDARWGNRATTATAGLSAAAVDAALTAAPDSPAARELLSVAIPVYLPNYSVTVSGAATAYVPIDTGLSETARHAKTLGYDGVVLFLDELVLWLAGLVTNPELQFREIDKVARLVESNDAARDVPLISFIARQRNLRELIGPNGTGAENLAFEDRQTYWEERFGTIPLEDRNLRAIANRRVLRPRSPDAEAQLDRAFDRTDALSAVQRDVLVGGEDRDAFRATYPFPPTFLDVLVHVSSALQRSRTALTLMRQLLVTHREELRLGDLVPLGDLWDALARGVDSPFSTRLKHEFDNAKDLYHRSLRPALLDLDRVGEAEIRAIADGSNADPATAARVRAFRGDDRLVKTLLIAGLVPEVQALRGLTVRRLVALNPGTVRTPIAGQEASLALAKLRKLQERVGQLRLGEGDDPTVSLRLVGVDTDAILAGVAHADSAGERRRRVRSALLGMLEVSDTQRLQLDKAFVWRGTSRTLEIVYGNVRDPHDLSDEQFTPVQPGAWRVVLDYPFDTGEHSAADDRSRVLRLPEQDAARCLVWLPAFLTQTSADALGTLLRIEHVLGAGRLAEYTRNLSDADRERARETLDSLRSALQGSLETTLLQAYGLRTAEDGRVEDWSDHLVSRMPGSTPKLDVGRSFGAALLALGRQLFDETYPRHPRLIGAHEGEAVRRPDLRLALGLVRSAAEDPDRRLDGLDAQQRAVLRRVLVPLRLGNENDGVFVLNDQVRQELAQRIAAQGLGTSGSPGVTVRQLRTWLAEDGLVGDVADLVAASFAGLDGRAWARPSGAVEAPDVGGLTDEMTLRPQELPSTAEWATARTRAQALFGIAFTSSALTARRLSQLAPVHDNAQQRHADLDDLERTLKRVGPRLGLDLTAANGRYAVTVAARDLLRDLRGRVAPLDIARTLATWPTAVPDQWLGTAIASARVQAEAIRGANWDALDAMDPYRPGEAAITASLHEAANASEFTVRLGERLARLGTEAVRALTQRPQPPVEPPQAGDGGTTPGRERRSTTTRGVGRGGAVRVVEDFFRNAPDATVTVVVTEE